MFGMIGILLSVAQAEPWVTQEMLLANINITPAEMACLNQGLGRYHNTCDEGDVGELQEFMHRVESLYDARERHGWERGMFTVDIRVQGRADGHPFSDRSHSGRRVVEHAFELRQSGALLDGMVFDEHNGSANDELACLRGVYGTLGFLPLLGRHQANAAAVVRGECVVSSVRSGNWRGIVVSARVRIDSPQRQAHVVERLLGWETDRIAVFDL